MDIAACALLIAGAVSWNGVIAGAILYVVASVVGFFESAFNLSYGTVQTSPHGLTLWSMVSIGLAIGCIVQARRQRREKMRAVSGDQSQGGAEL